MKSFSEYIEENTISEGDAMKGPFKDAIAVLFQAKLGKVSPADYAKAIKTVIDADDMSKISEAIINSVRGTVNETAQTLGIAEEATEEPAAEEAEEAPVEEAPVEEAPVEEAPAEAPAPAPAPVPESVQGTVVTESRISRMAEYYLD